MSITYILVILLTALSAYLGVKTDDSSVQTTAEVIVAIVLGLGALAGRHRAGGISKLGLRLK